MSMSLNECASHDLEIERVRMLPAALVAIDPSLEGRLEPCPAKSIAKLEKLHGSPLPGFYRVYLETIGKSLGTVRYYQDIDLDPKALEKWLERNRWRSGRFMLIGLCANEADIDAYLDFGEEGRDVGVAIFSQPSSGNPEQVQPLASSFAIYVAAAVAVRSIIDMPRHGAVFARSQVSGQLAAARRILTRAGLEEHPISGKWDKLFIGPRAIAVASELGGSAPLSITLGCLAPDEWRSLAGQLEHELKMRIGAGPVA